MSMKLDVVILAAGKGTRMRSKKPKVLHKLAGKSLLGHVVETARSLDADNIQVVIGHGGDEIRREFEGEQLNFVEQEQQLGTGHAVLQCLPCLRDDALALILYGDVPLLKKKTLQKLINEVGKSSLAVLSCDVDDPKGLGRIIRNNNGELLAIVEEKDAGEKERNINEINSGIMAMPVNRLKNWLPDLKNTNAQNEYYLTDVVALAVGQGERVVAVKNQDEREIAGVNDLIQLALIERYIQQENARKLMLQGVRIKDPQRFDLRGEGLIEQDVDIDVNVILEGKVIIKSGTKIGPNCLIKDCVIEEDSEIYANCVLEDVQLGKACSIGPFARIRPGSVLKESVKIGNFVEVKKSELGNGTKVNHLSYVGDSVVGEKVNVGAGTITCNYDGVNKHKTIIGNEVSVGANTSIVAPVKIEDGATIGAGSTITEDVLEKELALSRCKQTNIRGWKRPKK